MRTTRTTKNQKRGVPRFSAYRPSREIAPHLIKQLPCIGSNGKSRLRILTNSGAFNDLRDPSKPPDQQQDTQDLLNAWVEDNSDCRMFRQQKSRAALKVDTKGYDIPAPPIAQPNLVIPSDERATLVVDKDNFVLAYKFGIPEDLHQKLVESKIFLSQSKRENYSLWAKTMEEITMTSDYRRNLPESEKFFEHNRELWNVLDGVLRLLDPVMYKKYTNVDQFLKDDEKRLAGAWHGAIINRLTGSKEEAVPHKNWKDWAKGLTAMIPWGDYEGGDVKLYNLGLTFELKQCDVLFFNARCVSYGVQEVTKGIRNELNLIVHGTTIKWRQEKVTNGGTKRAEEKKSRERERKKRVKQRAGVTPKSNTVANRRARGIGTLRAVARPFAPTNSNITPLGVQEATQGTKEEKENTSPPTSNTSTPAKNTRAQRMQKASAANVSTNGSRVGQISAASGNNSVTQPDREEMGLERVRRERRAATKARDMRDALATGKTISQIKRERHAKKMEQQRLKSLEAKQKRKTKREIKKARQAAKRIAGAPMNGQGQKRKADNDAVGAAKKQKVAPAVKTEIASTAKIKAEPAAAKRGQQGERERQDEGGDLSRLSSFDTPRRKKTRLLELARL